MADDEKTIEHAECDRWDREEIHCSDHFPVVVQKGEPALGWFRISWRSFHPTRDRSLRDIKTEHQEFTVDARRPPGRVLGRVEQPSDLEPKSVEQRPDNSKSRPFEGHEESATRKIKGWPTLYDDVGSVKRQVECASCGQLVFVLT